MQSLHRLAFRGAVGFLLALLALVLADLARGAAAGTAPPVPAVPTRFVTDKAGILEPGAAAALEERLKRFEEETSNQFLVYTEKSVPEGTFLEEYTIAASQAWKVGQKDRRNGLILFVFPGSRAARFEVGYGLEGALPDAMASRILREEAIPSFKTGDYQAGVTKAVEAAIAATKGEYKGKGPSQRSVRRKGGGIPIPLLIVLLVFVVPLLFGGRRGFFFGGPFGGFGGGGGGGGSGGGFSGGGGSFGGGGASGDW